MWKIVATLLIALDWCSPIDSFYGFPLITEPSEYASALESVKARYVQLSWHAFIKPYVIRRGSLEYPEGELKCYVQDT